MVVCGDDGLAHRLAAELRDVYGERVTLVAPSSGRRIRQPVVGRARAASVALLDLVNSAVNRTGVLEPGRAGRELDAAEPTESVLAAAGVERAAALALVYDDDETNIRAALTARRLNPRLRLVLRLYNRRLGQHIEALLDQAATLAAGDPRTAALDASTTVLSDADTAAPALVATTLVGTSKVVETDGLLLRAVERQPPSEGEVADPGLCALALLSSNGAGDSGRAGSTSADEEPSLLPDQAAVDAATGRGIVALEEVAYAGPPAPPRRAAVPPFASLFSHRLRWSLAGLAACVAALTVALAILGPDDPPHAVYITLLNLFAINDPAVGRPLGEQILQLLTGLTGLLLLPVLLAAALEALGTFRTASALRGPPRGLKEHVVLLGLGKVGTRVLTRLRERHIPVVCVEADPDARGMATALRLRVPVVVGDATQEGVLEAAKIHKARSLLALTSVDSTNLEAVLYARSVRSDLSVVMRLFDDDFSTAVYRTLRATHPRALTRSRSVTQLAAPAFAGAVMGRQILGAIPVERRVLLFAAVTVAGQPQLEGRTVGEAFRAGAWRVLALDMGTSAGTPGPRGDGRAGPPLPSGLVWDLPDTYVLRGGDRVVMAATRQGLAELTGGRRRREGADA
ncbi:NAD-binding protein [Streptomyces sp. ZYX-F-203]